MIVVEDGTGLSDAETYCSADFVESYATGQNRASVWTALADDAKEAALREAALVLDGQFGSQFIGCRTKDDQALEWPRFNAVDDGGFYVDSDIVPAQVKKACAELALESLSQDGGQLVVNSTNSAPVVREMVKAGPVETETEYGAGGQLADHIDFRRVKFILRRLLRRRGELRRA